MTHDPLCPDSDLNGWVSKDFNGNSMSCRCEEYAKVREEERAAALDAAIASVREAIGEEWKGEIIPKAEYDCCGCSSYDGIVDDAVSAIRSLKEKP